ncbi:hypothetical protein PBS_49500 [Paraburkholderia sp. 2C]
MAAFHKSTRNGGAESGRRPGDKDDHSSFRWVEKGDKPTSIAAADQPRRDGRIGRSDGPRAGRRKVRASSEFIRLFRAAGGAAGPVAYSMRFQYTNALIPA